MKKNIASLAAAGLVAGAIFAPGTLFAASDAVEDAKDRCIVGEQMDGFIGIVDDSLASDSLRREIRDINQRRQAAYVNLARRNGVSTNVTAALTAEQLINDLGAGQCYRDQDGKWIQI